MHRFVRLVVVAATGLLLFTFLPTFEKPVSAQCVITTTTTRTNPYAADQIWKWMSEPALCWLTGANALVCFPSQTTTLELHYAEALPTTTNPYCHWSCTCGTGPPPHITIDTSDGLPIELMDFAVE